MSARPLVLFVHSSQRTERCILYYIQRLLYKEHVYIASDTREGNGDLEKMSRRIYINCVHLARFNLGAGRRRQRRR